MWQNIKSVTAFMCILVYIGAAAFAGMSVYNAVNEQRFDSRQEFAELADFATRAGALGFFTKDYIEDIRERLDLSPAIDALIIDGPYGRAAFEKKSGLISYNGDYPDFNKETLLYGEPQTAQIGTDGGIAASISVLSPLIDFNALLSTARLSFLAILVALTLAFATLIADVSIVKPAVPNSLALLNAASETYVASDSEAPPIPSAATSAAAQADQNEEIEDLGGTEDAAIGQADWQEEIEDLGGAEDAATGQADEYEELEELDGAEESAVGQAYEQEEIEDLGRDEDVATGQADEYEELEELCEAENTAIGQADEYEELEELDEAETPSENPAAGAGLLAAASALYQSDRLAGTDEGTEFPAILQQELTKAEKSGGDLAILSIEGTNADFPSEALIKQAAGFFKTGSRFFEKDDRTGIYIIVPDAGLDEMFAAAKDFYRRAAAETISGGTDLLIGLSARSARNVNGANLLNEAESALDKARADRSLPIVGFKADTKKYNDFIARQRFPV
jgi:hypothetical protein